MLHPRRRGMTLTEGAVWVGALALFTAVLVPTVRSHHATSDILRAREDVRAIAQALQRFNRDMKLMPAEGTADLLVTSGKMPLESGDAVVSPWNRGTTSMLRDHLIDNKPRYKSSAIAENGWSGPYMKEMPQSDPWGHRYIVNLGHDSIVNAVFVLSAGPDGEVQTPYAQEGESAVPHGDDIAYRLR